MKFSKKRKFPKNERAKQPLTLYDVLVGDIFAIIDRAMKPTLPERFWQNATFLKMRIFFLADGLPAAAGRLAKLITNHP